MAPWIDRRLLSLVAAPAIWAAMFLTVYASESVICSRLGSPRAHAALVVVAGLAALTGLTLLAVRAARKLDASGGSDARFYRAASLASALVSLVATLWTLAPAAMLPACTG